MTYIVSGGALNSTQTQTQNSINQYSGGKLRSRKRDWKTTVCRRPGNLRCPHVENRSSSNVSELMHSATALLERRSGDADLSLVSRRISASVVVDRRRCVTNTHTHTHTHPFNGPLSGNTRVSRYQKGKTSLEAKDSEWHWHQLGHMQVCTSLQTDNHANTPPLSFLQPDALPAAQPTASKH